MKGKYPYRERKLRQYRFDKKHPRRMRIQVKQDLGDKEETTTYTLPAIAEQQTKIIPKKKTGEWIVIYRGNGIKILKSLRHNRIYMFQENGEYLGELDDVDLAKLGFKSLMAVEALRWEWIGKISSSNKRYYRCVLNLKKIKTKIRQKHG